MADVYTINFTFANNVESAEITELKDDRIENYGAYIGFISK